MKHFFIFLLCMGFALTPLTAYAQLGTGVGTSISFGGWVAYTIPCTCSFSLWVFFTPLYLRGLPAPIVGPLVYTPGISTLYPYYLIGVPTTWELGDYVPGVQACLIGVPPACVILPSIGLMSRVGTSAPGFPP